MSTFVAVGNLRLPFQRLLAAVGELAPALPQPVIVQCGHTPFQAPGCIAHDFVEPGQFESEIRRAECLILHGGAGSIMQALAVGKCPVVVPRRAALGEHIDDHQIELAQWLADAGRIVLLDDNCRLPAAVAEARSRSCSSQPAASRQPPIVAMVREALLRS